LTEEKKGLLNNDIKWNFTKFLVDRQGNVIKRFASAVKPEQLTKHIEKLL
jgi:glutathione peroxidase